MEKRNGLSFSIHHELDKAAVTYDSEIKTGYFLTDQELEQFARKCFEAGRAEGDADKYGHKYLDFASYWAWNK